MDTKRLSFAETRELRMTEKAFMRQWFQNHPDKCISARDMEAIIKKPCNHCTRITADLLDEGTIEISHVAPSKFSNRMVNTSIPA